MVGLSLGLDPLRARASNAIGDCYILSCQATLMVWYVTALLSLAVLGCCVPGYAIQIEPSGLLTLYWLYLLEDLNFPNLMWAP